MKNTMPNEKSIFNSPLFVGKALLVCVPLIIAILAGCESGDEVVVERSRELVVSKGWNPDAVPAVVAVVGDFEISREEFLNEVRGVAGAARASASPGRPVAAFSETEYQKILDQLVNKHIILMLAAEAGIEADPRRVDANIATSKTRLGSSTAFHDFLSGIGTTEDLFRRQIHDSYTREDFAAKVSENCTVSEEELMREYERRVAGGKMQGPETVDFWHIVLRILPNADQDEWETALHKLMDAQQRILTGEDFSAVALEISEDADIKENEGFYASGVRSRMANEVQEVLFAIPLGEVSDPVKTEFGYHLFKVKSRQPEGLRRFDYVREDLAKDLLAECRRNAMAEKVTEGREAYGVTMLFRIEAPDNANGA